MEFDLEAFDEACKNVIKEINESADRVIEAHKQEREKLYDKIHNWVSVIEENKKLKEENKYYQFVNKEIKEENEILQKHEQLLIKRIKELENIPPPPPSSNSSDDEEEDIQSKKNYMIFGMPLQTKW